MIGFAENVVAYCEGLDLETFGRTGLNYDATVHNLELIGEAANHIPAHIREDNISIPWRQIIATRNRAIGCAEARSASYFNNQTMRFQVDYTGGTTPRTGEVELRQERQSRAMHGAITEES